jgi:solute carrier family 35, member F5
MQKTVFDDPFFFFQKERYDQRRRRYALGIFFIFLVSATWVVSSVISQFLYTERSFDSPFLVTYIGICLFTFILPVKWLTDKIGLTKDTTTTCASATVACLTTTAIPDDISVTTEYEDMVKHEQNKRRQQRKLAKKQEMLERRKKISDALSSNRSTTSNSTRTAAVVVVANESNNNKTSTKRTTTSQSEEEGGGGGTTGSVGTVDDDAVSVSSQYSASVSTVFDLNHPGKHWNHSKHIFVAMHIAPVLFIANWLFNASLQATSVVSATVLVSTSGMFVFILAVLAKEETFHWMKLLGVILGICGTVLTALHDFTVQDDYDQYSDTENCTTDGCDYNLWGDTLALLAAVAFASYAVQVRLLCPCDEEIYSMGLLLGYIGLFITIPLLPLAIVLMTRIDITYEIFILIVLRGLFDYVISEYLHFRSVVLTNATIATVGLGLTIPMAFIADFVMGKANITSLSSLLGAICVSAGFILVNIADGEDGGHGHGQHNQSSDGIMNNHPSGQELLANGIPMNIIQQQQQPDEPYKSRLVL